MRFSCLILFIISLSLQASPIHSLLWHHRFLLLFSPENNDVRITRFIQQQAMHRCQLNERHIITGVITKEQGKLSGKVLSKREIKALQQIYLADDKEFAIVLIGKDGHEKYRWQQDTDWRQLNELIDSTPMRQREMQQRASPCET